MKKFIRSLPIFLSVAMMAGIPVAGYSQQKPEQTRQERIQEHQERIKKILEESRKRRAEQQEQLKAKQAKNPPAAPGAAPAQPTPRAGTPASPPVAARPGQPLPTGPVQNARVTPAVQNAAKATPPPDVPKGARSESRTILLFHPVDSIVSVGERFKTDVLAETKEGEVDEISILLKYPRHVLNPLALDHSAIDPYVKKNIDYEFNPDNGTIYIHTKLSKPRRFDQKPLVSVIWEALEATDGSNISYLFGKKGQQTTGLYLNGSNILGTMPGSNDGVIKSSVQVMGPRVKPTLKKVSNGVIIGSLPETSLDDRPGQSMNLSLKTDAGSVRPGEKFNVDVVLNNPGEKRLDKIQLYLQFDPSALEVVDSDAGNVVKRGININDSDAREQFPFSFYRYNYADNKEGVIVYEVSASNSQVRGSGKFATIKFKALKDVPRAEIVLVQNSDGLTPTSDVDFLGESQLKDKSAPNSAKALAGIAVQIAGRAVAENENDAPENVYNPFISNLARRMRNASNQ